MWMVKFWEKVTNDETAQALAGVLILLVVGGLVIAPCLSYVSTGLESSRVLIRNVNGLYAADAGVGDVLWCLENGLPVHTELPENLNGMAVTMQTEEKGEYTLSGGELVTGGGHDDWLGLDSDIVWDGGAGAYKYDITVTWQAEPETLIHLEKVGARLPVGYDYQPGSAALFGDNLSTDEPTDELDGSGAHLLEWVLPPPRPWVDESNPTRTQTFYMTGVGDLVDYYSWVVATRNDVGSVGEITGILYQITAVATCPQTSETTAVLVAEVILSGGEASIVSWQTS